MTNNDTKGTPCYLGDVLGDWREEVIMRTADNKIRIYTTTIPTEWRNYTLWHDMQYRQAMVWQMCGYNQPPHTSYFLGELEGITVAPPALTMTGRTEVANGGTIGSAQNNQQVLMAETGDMTVSVSDGAAPYIFFDNAPSWVQGTDVNGTSGKDAPINYSYYTHTLTGGAFTGNMRLVKQGDGTLVLPKVTQTYTGNTDVWAGTLQFDGIMQASPIWLNRHTSLVSNGGTFNGGIKADYNATIYPGGKENVGTLATTTLDLGFGSRIVIDVNTDGTADKLTATKLTIEKKDWQYGPKYSTPVIAFNGTTLAARKYEIATIGEMAGNLDDIKLEGLNDLKKSLIFENGKLYLNIEPLRQATDVTWAGGTNGIWDFADTENFKRDGGQSDVFVSGDFVTFDDNATQTGITINDDLTPGNIVFTNNSKNFTLEGTGSIIGATPLTMNGEGQVTINNKNQMTGGVNLNKGTMNVSTLANEIGQEYGALGTIANTITMNGGTLGITGTLNSGQPISLGAEGGSIHVASDMTMTQQGSISKQSATSTAVLHKTGAGTLELGTANDFATLSIDEGSVQLNEKNTVMNGPAKIIFNGSDVKLHDANDSYSYSKNNINYEVSEGSTGYLYLDSRCDYSGKLTGKGTLHVIATWVRNYLKGDWSQFEGTLVAHTEKWDKNNDPVFNWENNYGLPKATLNIPSGITFTAGSRNITLGNLTGSGTLATSGTVTIGSLNEDITYTGTFSGTKVIKTGTGSWTFTRPVSGVSSYTFKGGDIQLNSTNSTPLFGSSLATVENEAVLKGTGTVAALTIQNGGTLMPGSYTSSRRYGAIVSTGTVSLYAGSKLYLAVYNKNNNNTSRSYLTIGGDLKLNGDIYVELGSSYTPAAGDEIIFWTVAKEVTGTPTLHLPEPARRTLLGHHRPADQGRQACASPTNPPASTP